MVSFEGVLASNFLIILIAIERYSAIYKLNFNSFRFRPFYLRLITIVLVSIVISVFNMLQSSVYQIVGNNQVVFIGICLPSERTFKFELSKIIRLVVTSILIVGSVFVMLTYTAIFKRSLELNKRRKVRKLKEDNIRMKLCGNVLTASKSSTNEPEVKLSLMKSKKLKRPSHLTNKRNLRIAVMIFLVTLIYYLSIIPWCLTINSIIEYNPFIFYTFLLNSTLNPFIYGVFNPYFRNCCIFFVEFCCNFFKSVFFCK